MQGGFTVEELFAASVTTLDIIVVYVLLRVKGRRLVLALWTGFLNVMLPLLGFMMGELSATIFADWSVLLSGVILSLIGLHMLLQDNNEQSTMIKLHPAFIAFVVSIDAFSVSVTFGMLQLNKLLYIMASGIFAFVFSLTALYFQKKLGVKNGNRIRQFAGVSLLIMGILSCIR
ncbi:hypothetical protein BI350_15650 [Sporosarcina ureilytica]|uniref:Manganese efflux pump MntP n=1 Tax=Sporosarcina ureilytica TaxID=298596 RepID=A0A1D8JJI0_9BACL|nr:hypothetical protein BI350_15650 [Sporosarcina ureilytica]